ncbi:MAG: ABC transporter permease subunit [Phycisphaerae bacterium]
MSSRVSWLAIRKDFPAGRSFVLKVCAFLIPLAVWAVVSYVPWIWHPQMRVVTVGDSYYQAGDLVDKSDFKAANADLTSDHKVVATGVPANPIFLPAPDLVARAFVKAFDTAPYNRGDPWLHQEIFSSIKVIFWGFLLSAVIGVPLGVICGTFRLFSLLIEPFVDFIRYMPAPAFGALCVAILGIEQAPKIAIIFIGTFFQMVLVISNTTRLLDGSLLEAAQTLGAKKVSLVTKVIIPGILPNLYNDMRILLGWAWTYLIIGELIGSMSGITRFIYNNGRHFHFENVYAAVIMIGIIGFATDQFLGLIGGVLFPWQNQGSNVVARFFGYLFKTPGEVGRVSSDDDTPEPTSGPGKPLTILAPVVTEASTPISPLIAVAE